jgi:tRNA A37 threonylcarbamoyltransferase TsaD
MDGSEIYLGLLSGSNTTVEQLHKEIIMVNHIHAHFVAQRFSELISKLIF